MSEYWWRVGSFVWVASGAGWFVMFAVTELPECFVVSVACLVAAMAWNLLIEPKE